MRSDVEVEALRELHDTLKNRIRALDALGKHPMIHSCILLPIFETKLPPELSEKWELELTDVKEEDVNIEFFFKFLNKQVLSKEAGQRSTNLNVEAVTQCQSSGLMSESIAQNSAGKSGVVRSNRERISTVRQVKEVLLSVICAERGDTKLQSVQDLSEAQSMARTNDGKLLENIACALTVLRP